jgi:hypothetical protein
MSLVLNESPQSSSLFLPSDQTPSSPGWYGYIIAQGPASKTLKLSDIWQGGNYSGGLLVFCRQEPQNLAAFVQQCLSILQGQSASIVLTLAWVHNDDVANFVADLLAIVSDWPQPIVTSNPSPTVHVGDNYVLVPPGDTPVTLNPTSNPPSFMIGSSSTKIGLVANNISFSASQMELFLSGPLRGCLQFSLTASRSNDLDVLDVGVRFYFSGGNGTVNSLRYPIFDLGSGSIPFQVTVDPTTPTNSSRSSFTFLDNATALNTFFATSLGQSFMLTPVANSARLVFSGYPGSLPPNPVSPNLTLTPDGDFTISAAQNTATADLLCGLQGTEYITVNPQLKIGAGDIARFVSGRPGYARNYPFPNVSPLGVPTDPTAPLFFDDCVTSWVSMVRAVGNTSPIPYVAQPQGSSLYGLDKLINKSFPALYGSKEPSVGLPATGVAFPLVPYAGVTPGSGTTPPAAALIEDFERQVIGPSRRQIIGAAATKIVQPDAPYNATTPSGVIVKVGPDGSWTQILLGQNPPRKMCFCDPKLPLQQAFQTNQLFLVVANAANLGTLVTDTTGDCTTQSFFNTMNVLDWVFSANVGQSNQYNDYRNVMIVKGRAGALYDPTSAQTKQDSLVSNPDKWTQKEVFASPSDSSGAPNPGELTILSQWLQQYFEAAAAQPDTDSFGNFNTIAMDPNWTGILVLRMDIASIPTNLAGIMAGVADPSQFNAHHFGVNISQVINQPNAQPALAGASSIFGLIYYVDPAFTPPAKNQTPMPVLPATGVDYDFRLLMLKVLFENTTIKSFQSYAQITMNEIFGMSVTGMGTGGMYNTIVLTGSYQNNNGHPTYSLASTADNTFYFASNIFNKIEITSAQMTTRNPGNQITNPTVISWFGLNGFLDFQTVVKVVTEEDGPPQKIPFDILSFGSQTGQEKTPRQGLSFSNLGIQMSFPKNNPTDPTKRQLLFVSDEIRFDPATSTPRAGSLYINFALDLQGLQTGTADSTPSSAGFLPVITDARLTGVDGGNWYGLKYKLNMGTPGNLAGKIGLTSYLITAWSPDSSGDDGSYQALVGLELPGTGGGAKLISLQNVLKLSIGQLRLTRDDAQNSFLLMLTDIALKFLGMLKLPPNGATLFYLFGNPQSEGKASGLGWYAVYNQNPSEQKNLALAAAPEEDRI